MFKVNLVTRDGASIEFEADPNDTLLDAAAKAPHLRKRRWTRERRSHKALQLEKTV
ncbi:MAG: hypothetical protein ACR65X_08110 [Methylocystis sp.]|jgi:hypothetical protein|nr:Oxidoreductase FAD/NAD(P)-binding domain protein [Methylocystis sp. SC2]